MPKRKKISRLQTINPPTDSNIAQTRHRRDFFTQATRLIQNGRPDIQFESMLARSSYLRKILQTPMAEDFNLSELRTSLLAALTGFRDNVQNNYLNHIALKNNIKFAAWYVQSFDDRIYRNVLTAPGWCIALVTMYLIKGGWYDDWNQNFMGNYIYGNSAALAFNAIMKGQEYMYLADNPKQLKRELKKLGIGGRLTLSNDPFGSAEYGDQSVQAHAFKTMSVNNVTVSDTLKQAAYGPQGWTIRSCLRAMYNGGWNGAYLSLKFNPSGGHGLAIAHNASRNVYYFNDPNFGVFKVRGMMKFSQFLNLYFENEYEDVEMSVRNVNNVKNVIFRFVTNANYDPWNK